MSSSYCYHENCYVVYIASLVSGPCLGGPTIQQWGWAGTLSALFFPACRNRAHMSPGVWVELAVVQPMHMAVASLGDMSGGISRGDMIDCSCTRQLECDEQLRKPVCRDLAAPRVPGPWGNFIECRVLYPVSSIESSTPRFPADHMQKFLYVTSRLCMLEAKLFEVLLFCHIPGNTCRQTASPAQPIAAVYRLSLLTKIQLR